MILGPNCHATTLRKEKEEDLVHQTQTALAHLPLYMWDQSGELGETDNDDWGTQVNAFPVSIQVSQNGMFIM